MSSTIRTYSELSKLKTLAERYEYLKLDGFVGKTTFGFDRYINQRFYKSREWLSIRRSVILRDEACDLGLIDYPIAGQVLVHHMNPLSPTDIIGSSDYLLNPEYLICVSLGTHNAIHYGDESQLQVPVVERRPGDTTLW